LKYELLFGISKPNLLLSKSSGVQFQRISSEYSLVMVVIDPNLSIMELLQMAADNHHKKIELAEDEKRELIAILKKRAMDELEYGQEIELDTVRLIRRVTGAVGVYFT
jgi:hypothetical protein